MLHDANLAARSGKDEGDEVGFSHAVKDTGYHAKETEGNVGFEQGNNMIKSAFLKSIWCLG